MSGVHVVPDVDEIVDVAASLGIRLNSDEAASTGPTSRRTWPPVTDSLNLA